MRSDTELDISVIICTWNRAPVLARALERLASIHLPSDLYWEVLIVNNNCSDDTEDVVRSFAGRLPIRSVIETDQGLSAARNRGIAESRGDLLLWIDDDVLVTDPWLGSYAKALLDFPRSSFFGGPILPFFDSPPPAWLRQGWQQVSSAYGFRNLGTEPFAFTCKDLPYGGNFAVRRNVQERFLFDAQLGRKDEQLLGGEETDLMIRILRAGNEGLWLPDAKVEHLIGADRQSLRYLRRRYWSFGATEIRMSISRSREGEMPFPCRSVLGIPPWLLRRALENEFQFWLTRWFADPQEWLVRFKNSSIQWGMICERHRLHRSGAPLNPP